MLEVDDPSIHAPDRLRHFRRRARDSGLTVRDRFFLADRFTSYGLPDEAMAIIEWLKRDNVTNASARLYLERLTRINIYPAFPK